MLACPDVTLLCRQPLHTSNEVAFSATLNTLEQTEIRRLTEASLKPLFLDYVSVG